MGWLTDLLKEIPISAVLKEKITTIEDRYAASETENAILKDDLREAKAEITKLKNEAQELTKDEVRLLSLLAEPSGAFAQPSWTTHVINERLIIPYYQLRYFLHKLESDQYLVSTRASHSSSVQYSLAQKGREYLIKNKVL